MTNKYNNSKIYKITTTNSNNVYIGATVLELSERLKYHEQAYNANIKGKRGYMTSFEILKQGNYEITLIINVNVETKKELDKIEGQYIKNEKNRVNKIITGRTPEEYRTDNAKNLKESRKKYRTDNADKILTSNQRYRSENIDKILEYEKNYRTEHAEHKKIQQKEYRNTNRDIINAKKRVKIQCECGEHYTSSHKKRHYNSDTHKNKLLEKNK
jgi:hypothetical protein